jgi:alpha-glucosidase
MRLILAFLLLLSAAFAQDERRVTSPDGQIEFRIRITLPDPAALNQLAYQVSFHGKPLIDTSFLGLDILYQPLLGAKLGLLSSHTGKGDHYQSLVAEYMQDGSTGRLINVEVRAYNDGVAFRYVVPKSNPLADIRIEGEETEFRLAQKTDTVGRISPEALNRLPFIVEETGVGWIAINEVPKANYGRMSLIHVNDATLISHLATNGGTPNLAFDGTTPLTGPWRVILIGSSRSQLLESKLVSSLGQ